MIFPRICLFLYIIVGVKFTSNLVTASFNHYEIESHFHNKLFVVNLTCSDDEAASAAENRQLDKRSLAPYDAFKNDVTLDELRPENRPLNFSDYESVSKHPNLNHVHDSKDKDKRKHSHEGGDDGGGVHYDAEHGPYPQKDGAGNAKKMLLNINCHSIELNSMFINYTAKHLKIKSTGTLDISPEWATNSTGLIVLKIKSETGIVIPSDCSWVSPTIHSLDLAYTPLETFSLRNCTSSLRKVLLQGASLHNLSLHLPSVEILDASWNLLSGNGIELHPGEFNKNTKDLKLHNNQLSHWSSCGWPSITNLELQNNELVTINLSSCPLHNLVQLDLSHNQLTHPPPSYPLKLSKVNLSHNHIKTINSFNRLIQDVDLSHNLLTSIGRGTFRSGTQLLSLDLSHNHITVVYGHDFVGLHALRYLDLSHNSITHIRHEAFFPFAFILSINIENNYIHQLDARLFANLPSNLQLHATNNPWRCSCHLVASLSKASTSFCKPNCPELPKLYCHEGESEVWSQDLLRQCVENMQNIESVHSVHLLPENNGSDEDTSEEKVESVSNYYMAILIAVLVLVIPVIGVGIRKIYLKRKNIKRWCNCLSPSHTEVSDGRWSAQMDRESDSETEF